MDAKADRRFNSANWPREGAPLAEAIERIAGPELLAKCRAARAAAPPFGCEFGQDLVWPVWPPDNNTGKHQWATAVTLVKRFKVIMRTCLTPVIDVWDAGEIQATGRWQDVLAAAIEIPAPANLWVVKFVDLERSIVNGPNGGLIFYLRFHVVETQPRPAMAPVMVEAQPRPAMVPVKWLESAVADLKRTGNVPEKPTEVARMLRTRMIADADQGVVKKVLKERTLVNYLKDFL